MKRILAIIFLIIITGCGFKVVDLSKTNNFSIGEIASSGDKRINYIIKNKLISNTDNSGEERFDLKINSIKSKTVKERNIQNEITKYIISISVSVEVNNINKNNLHKLSFTETGDYNVSKQNATNR
ncbi:hypothetical protein OAR49_01025, partial [Pelagibacteraceae bacterium]|nr:hypothetical protein [Pelagibacteraceae bacterium]